MTNEELKPENTVNEQVNTSIENDTNSVESNIEQKTQENASVTADTDSLQATIKEWEDKYLRLYAEFDNYRKRTTNERIDLIRTANQEVLVALLPVLDDFERATKSFETATDVNPVKEGVALVHHKLRNILTSKGLKLMESQGLAFNPDLHEAITNIPAPSDDMKGKVLDVVEQGYYLGEKVIRYAKVVVGE
jgi:molecular chaperone GrpE